MIRLEAHNPEVNPWLGRWQHYVNYPDEVSEGLHMKFSDTLLYGSEQTLRMWLHVTNQARGVSRGGRR